MAGYGYTNENGVIQLFTYSDSGNTANIDFDQDIYDRIVFDTTYTREEEVLLPEEFPDVEGDPPTPYPE